MKILIRLFGWKHGWKVLRRNVFTETYVSSHIPNGNEYPIGEKVVRENKRLRGKKRLFGPLAVFDNQGCAEAFRRESCGGILKRSTHPCIYKPSKNNRYWRYAIVMGRVKKIRGGWMPDGKAFADAVIIL